MEAIHRDYSPRGVQFFYIYKYLAHAGNKGYVQPFTLSERLLHIKEAKQSLGTQIEWICDTMDNDLKHAFGDAPTSEFIVDPEGKIVRRRAWGDARQMRHDLEELIGPVANPTDAADLKLNTQVSPKVASSGIVKRIARPKSMKPLHVVPVIKSGALPFYVKLRPQATRALLSSGTGQLYLEFRLDPIYGVHWNNLADPIRIELDSPSGTVVTPSDVEGPKVEEPADVDPREFLIDVANWGYEAPLHVTVKYFACNDDQGWCVPVTQRYDIDLTEDVEDGYYVTPMAHAGVWPSFRGPSGNGISAAKNVPLTWGPNDNVAWRAELPTAGNSSPVVAGDCVLITCAQNQGQQRSLYSFDRSTGKQLWVRTVEFNRVMPTHKSSPYCASTPLVAGNRVVVWHGSAGLFCYNLAGQLLWSRDLGDFRHMWGYASSPIFYSDRIILNCGPGKRSFLTAFDLVSGETLWQTDEPTEGDGQRNEAGKYTGSWTTPIIARVGGKDQVICSMATRVNGYDPNSGKILWTCRGLRGRKGDLAYSSPIVAGDMCVALGGFHGPAIGIQLGATGDISERAQRWRTEPNPQNIGSGVLVDRHIFVPDAEPGTLRCIEPGTGKVVWQQRMPGGPAWGSIVVAAGRAYITCQRGDTVVFVPRAEGYQELAVNSLGEPSNSTPAVAEGELFLRTFEALYCIRDAN